MIQKIHHLGIGVKNLKEAISFFKNTLGLSVEKELEWEFLGLRAAIFCVGDIKFELIEPVEPKGEVAKSLAAAINIKDGIVHHLCFAVDNIDDEVKKLISKGTEMLTKEPMETPNGKIAWLDEQVYDGFMIELCDEGYKIS